MGDMTGKIIRISGMIIEIVSDEGESWECRNLTTQETLAMPKTVIEKAIKLGKADIVPNQDEH